MMDIAGLLNESVVGLLSAKWAQPPKTRKAVLFFRERVLQRASKTEKHTIQHGQRNGSQGWRFSAGEALTFQEPRKW